MNRLALLALFLAPLAHSQSLPYYLKKTDSGQLDATAVQQNFEYQANQTKQLKAQMANLTVGGFVMSVSAASPLCATGGQNPSLSFCGTIYEYQVNNLVEDLANINLAFNSYLPIAGGTMLGPLTLDAGLSLSSNTTISTGGLLYISSAPAVSPEIVISSNGYTLQVNGSEYVTGQQITGGTMTVQGSAFSVGGTGFSVTAGSATLAYQITAGSFTGGPISRFDVSLDTVTAQFVLVAAATTTIAANLATEATAVAASTTALSASTVTIASNLATESTAIAASTTTLSASTVTLASQFITDSSSYTNTSAKGILVTSSATAGAFFGDASHLTGLPASGVASNTFFSSVTINMAGGYSGDYLNMLPELSAGTNQTWLQFGTGWQMRETKDGSGNSTLNIDRQTTGGTNDLINLNAEGGSIIIAQTSSTFSGNIVFSGANDFITAPSSMTASAFFGDGSHLTGLASDINFSTITTQFNAVASATTTIASNLTTETGVVSTLATAVAASTTALSASTVTLAGLVYTLGSSTASIQTQVNAISFSTITTQFNAVASATTTLSASTVTLNSNFLNYAALAGPGTGASVNFTTTVVIQGLNAVPQTSGSGGIDGNFRLSQRVSGQVLDAGLYTPGSGTPYSWIQDTYTSGYNSHSELLLNPNGGAIGIGSTNIDSNVALDVGGRFRVFAAGNSPATGQGLEIYGGASPALIAYDRTANTYLNINMNGLLYIATTGAGLGNVGIGTASPIAFFNIASSTGATQMVVDVSSQNAAGMFTILGNGNIGIGTTNPGYPLEVKGQITSKTTGGTSAIALLETQQTGSKAALQIEPNSSLQWYIGSDVGLSDDTTLEFYGSTIGKDAMVIKASNGNVGIGTTSPGSILDVFAAATSSVIIHAGLSGDTANLEFKHDYASPNERNWTISPGISAYGSFELWQSTAAFVDPLAAGAGTNRLFIASGGNVGIGTTNPGYPLEVSGSAQFDTTVGINSTLTATGNSHLGTTTGTQLYRCSGGTDAGWILYGSSSATATLCTGGGGTLVATGVYLP